MINETASNQLPTAPASVVEAFLYAVMRDEDLHVVGALLAEDAVYENVGFSTLRGGHRITSTFRKLASRVPILKFDVEIHRIATSGTSVLTERTDSVIIGSFRANFWVFGVFNVCDGRITLWRDYFDVMDMVRGIVRGLLAQLIPSFQR